MKFYFHLPGYLLIAVCGLACCLCGWERAELWLAKCLMETEKDMGLRR